MINGERLLALVPARGRSKRLRKKNILSFGGNPLISWTITAGLASEFVDRLIVSTEDQEIADISKAWGADVPFMRPPELATDEAETIDVVCDAIKELESIEDRYQYLLVLQPTSPLRTTRHINEAIELLSKKRADSVIGVTELEHPLEWTDTIPENLSMDGFFSQIRSSTTRSQNYPTRYRINGAIYLGRISRILSENSLFLGHGSFAYKMDHSCSIDIDTENDFIFAEVLLQKSKITSP